MPASALTKDINCHITFYTSYRVFQELGMGQMISGGIDNNGVYTFDFKKIESRALHSKVVNENKVL